MVITPTIRKDVLHHLHDNASHPGIKRTKRLVFDKYWWPGWSDFVKEYVRTCHTCRDSSPDYNTLCHSVTNSAPECLHVGRHLPPDANLQSIPVEASRRSSKVQDNRKAQHDSRHKPSNYDNGDLVVIRVPDNHSMNFQFSASFDGIFAIVSKLREDTYRLRRLQTSVGVKHAFPDETTAHTSRLKQYFQRFEDNVPVMPNSGEIQTNFALFTDRISPPTKSALRRIRSGRRHRWMDRFGLRRGEYGPIGLKAGE